jgi:vancomycin resistance protein YoaR
LTAAAAFDQIEAPDRMPAPPPVHRPEGHTLLVWIGAAACVGILLGFALIPRATELPAPASAAGLSLYGRPLPDGGDPAEVAAAWIRERSAGGFELELPEGRVRRVQHSELGVELDLARLHQLIGAARDPASSFSRRRRERGPRGPIELPVPLRLDVARALPTLSSLKQELDRDARDARLDLDHGAVLRERAGRLLDLDASLQAIEQALHQGSQRAVLVFQQRPPRRLAADLDDVRHDILLGFFETPYDAAARAQDRTFNLRLAASRLDGYVLLPGDELEFNAVVGPRDEANGYRVAQVIAQGELVDGIGGSTCQISGTLHAAALFAGLDIVERHPHTRPSSYIKLGFDAAVVYPTIDLRLKNPYDFPVVLRQKLADGKVRAEVRGARRPHLISIVRKIDGATPFERLERADATLPSGMRVVAQRGVPGIQLHRYRIRRDGAHSIRETTIDRYPPTAQLVRVGTGKASANAVRPWSPVAREYLADELLVLSQTAQTDAPLLEQRTPGIFGSAGWTENIGAPVGMVAAE